jgi:hypothetical protein
MQALADALARKHPGLGFTPRPDLGGSLLAAEPVAVNGTVPLKAA